MARSSGCISYDRSKGGSRVRRRMRWMGETPPDFHPGDHCSCHSETQKSAYLWHTCCLSLTWWNGREAKTIKGHKGTGSWTQRVLPTSLTTQMFGGEKGGCDGLAVVTKHHGSLFDVRAGTLWPHIREGPSRAQLDLIRSRKAGTTYLTYVTYVM